LKIEHKKSLTIILQGFLYLLCLLFLSYEIDIP